MSRIVRTEPASRVRSKLIESISLALSQMAPTAPDALEGYDILAFIGLALQEISESVEQTAASWEKRGYWLKADRFRLEWAWSNDVGKNMDAALAQRDWTAASELARSLEAYATTPKPLKKQEGRHPWAGAWEGWESKRR